MRKFTLMLAFLLFVGLNFASAQTRTISGTVTSADDGSAIPGVTVQVKGTTNGTITDFNGKYSITVDLKEGNTLVFSFVGMGTQEIPIGNSNTINVVMKASSLSLNQVVVTALGISREKKSLGYATTDLSGSSVAAVKSDNVINSLSGRVPGLQIKNSGNLGGSTNVVIRGYKSLTGNNQALFVVDGVPVTNMTTNSGYQSVGGAGYDYGSPLSDINASDIKSINVLKGAAATALYGSRAANGVVIITTKSGRDISHKGIGITFSSNTSVGTIDKSTFPTYQTQYGAGYGPYYSGPWDAIGTPSEHPFLARAIIDGKVSWVVPTTEDASYGAKFDPNLMVYQWDAFVPESPYYNKARPWVNAAHGPATFFNTSVSETNTLALSGASKNSSIRVSYTNFHQKGVVPNSKLLKNTFTLNASQKLRKNLKVTAVASYIRQNTTGRNGTGYNDNFLTSFRQWWEMNVDVQELKDLYEKTGRNVTWNMSDPLNGNVKPIYWNNFYWERYKNYETDLRNHFMGNVTLKWDITDYLSVTGRASVDNYNTLQEERKAVGSVPGAFGIGLGTVASGYARYNLSSLEANYDLMVNFTKNLGKNFNLSAMVGGHIRRTNRSSIYASTNGGLTVPDLYAIANSKNSPLAALEGESKIGVYAWFSSVSLGWNNMVYLDATLRRDMASTLPLDNMVYYYPSVSTSFIFSKLIKADWLPFAKVRFNYAEVGNDAPFASIFDTYAQPSPFGNVILFSVPGTKNNQHLKQEQTKSIEAGLEMTFLHKRLGFDLSLYNTHTVNQIMPVSVTRASGYSTKYVNAGEIQNKGIELNVHGTPIESKTVNWTININWSENRNKVLSLFENVHNLQLGSFQGGVTLNATVGQPYGTIQGRDFVYKNGQKVVGANGFYEKTTTTSNVIGDINPKWHSGITNTVTVKNWTVSFLIDIQKGGSVFSLDQYYGQGTGLYPNTVGTNDLGNPMRNSLSDGGGIILPGVTEDGKPNTKRVPAERYSGPFGWVRNPNAAFVYDASYVKLREAQISYRFPKRLLKDTGIRSLSLGVVGSNLWVIFKNLPYADPEAGLGAGNLQGWQSGVMPTIRNIGFNLNIQF
jgi:TonB-linked SusC/RagA family outer membrane protein